MAEMPEAGESEGAKSEGERKTNARMLRVKVVEDGHPAVNVKVPLRVAKWGMKMAQAFSPEMRGADVDWDEMMSFLDAAEDGKIVEVEDEANHKTVEVWVE